MNSVYNSLKQFRLINIKTALNTIKECNTTKIDVTAAHNSFIPKAKSVTFLPRSLNIELGIKPENDKSKQDPLSYTPIINPRSIQPLIDNWRKDEIALPTPKKEEIQAIRLIVIRRKKMKKHQRRKLWKKMRHRWARVRQRRRQIKEKVFQNELLALIKQSEEFTAEGYVAGKIARVNNVPLPSHFKGRRLPPFIIRQLLGIDKKINYKHSDVYKA